MKDAAKISSKALAVVVMLSIVALLVPPVAGRVIESLTIRNNAPEPLEFDLSNGEDWLTFAPLAGTVTPYSSTPVTTATDSTGLSEGYYSDVIGVSSNDPNDSLVLVPADIEVRSMIWLSSVEETLYESGDVTTELYPGDWIEVEKSFWLPVLPPEQTPAVDIFLLEDETGSFWDDIANLKTLAPRIFDEVRAWIPDSRFGVGGFRDFPFGTWGNDWDPDYAYRLLQDLTFDRDAFLAGVDDLTAGGGYDNPEAQYEALYQVATGVGVDLNSDGDFLDFGEVASDLGPTFRLDALKVVVLATDDEFHHGGELFDSWGDPNPFPYPGPTRDEVVAALEAAGIVVIGIEPQLNQIAQLHDIAEATDGLVETVSDSGAEIVDAIVDGLSAIVGYEEVVPHVVGDPPLEVTFLPERYENVVGGQWIGFDGTVSVPWGTAAGQYSFQVEFLGDGQVLAVQQLTITVFTQFDWIVMLYAAADNSLDTSWWSVLEAQLGEIEDADYYGPTRAVLLVDGWSGSEGDDSRMLVKTFNGLREVDDEGAVVPGNGETNMGDPDTLESFIDWVKARYSSQNYALILADHSTGWGSGGFLRDWTEDDNLTTGELGAALAGATSDGADKLQLVGFDTCLMQILEVDYQIRNYAEYVVGSEEVEPLTGWPYGAILSGLAAAHYSGSAYSPVELAEFIVSADASQHTIGDEPGGMEGFPRYTISARDLSQMDALASAVDDFAAALLSKIATNDEEVAAARAGVETFGDGDWYYDDSTSDPGHSVGSIDLYHFAQLIAASSVDTGLSDAASAVMSAVDNAVVCNLAGEEHPNANGIAIYYPDVESPGEWSDYTAATDEASVTDGSFQSIWYEARYDADSDLPVDTLWDEYLKRAPRLVQPGMLALYIPDVLILAHISQDCIIRLDWPETPFQDVAGFTLVKPVDIFVTPEGAIDLGRVLLAYSQADLNAAGILRAQLIGIAQRDGDAWSLVKRTMNLPMWQFDIDIDPPADLLWNDSDWASAGDGFEDLVALDSAFDAVEGLISQPASACADYIGAVVSAQWFDLRNITPDLYQDVPNLPVVGSTLINSLAMIATNQEDHLNPIQYPQNLYRGWNLLSLPVIPLDSDVGTILSGHDGVVEGVTEKVDVVWEYEAGTGEWHAYSPSAPAEVDDLTDLEDGSGYWVKMLEDATMTVVGSNFLAGPHDPPEYDLVLGWNLIGYKGVLPIAPHYYLEEDDVEYNRLLGYHRSYGALYTPEKLYPGDGYWIYVVNRGSIPGVNDEILIDQESNLYGWVHYWMLHDGELALALRWNAQCYERWMYMPSMIDYGTADG